MTAVEVFKFPATGAAVRTIVRNGEPWFVTRDVCAVLGIANGRDAVARLDPDGVGTADVIDSMGRTQTASVVNESGLYELIFQSRKPEARAFRRWVTQDVLPAIRRTGRYDLAPVHAVPQSFADALQLAADQARQIEQQREQLAITAPKAHSWDTLAAAHGDYDVAHAAQILSRDPAITTGRDRLFAYLNGQGWIRRDPTTGRWRAYQRAVDARWLSELPQQHYDRQTGEQILDPPQVRVTVKGLNRLHHLLGGTGPLVLHEQGALL